ncbi:MAG: methyltransferase domain-containing protein [Flavobacteriales bacterium]|nr:methyltransferase domain-containing protein [Flavobacteriales bacterium]
MSNTQQKEIVRYYEECDNAYRDAWGMDKNMQLNLGIWEKDTKNLSEALLNLNRQVAKHANISKDDIVLDAGCGVGGTAIYFATHFGCKCVGITLTPHQAEKARANAKKSKVDHLVSFEVMDFTNTSFPDESFTLVTGIESICYAEPKMAFLKEAKRLLKKGGRMVLADNLQGKDELNEKEYRSLYTNAFNGCKVDSLDTAKQYRNNLAELNFEQIDCIDETKRIRPSIVRLRKFYYLAAVYNFAHRLIGKRFSKTQEANTKMCYHLLSSLDNGLWTYGIVKATK